jgi:DnaJ-class molecular chaperone
MPMEKMVIGRRFNPDRYGMIYCPVCKGAGKLSNGVEGHVVCKICGGFGFIKQEEDTNFDDHGVRSS